MDLIGRKSFVQRNITDIYEVSQLTTVGAAVVSGVGIAALGVGWKWTGCVLTGLSGSALLFSGVILCLSKKGALEQRRVDAEKHERLDKCARVWWAKEGNGTCQEHNRAIREIGWAYRTNASELYLNGLKLSSLFLVEELTSLKTLVLHDNRFSELPRDIFDNLSNLERLVLSSNRFTRLPESIESLPNLKILNLENNQLTHVPASFRNLKNLEVLVLDGNALKLPPMFLADNPKLKIRHNLPRGIVSSGFEAIAYAQEQIRQGQQIDLSQHRELLEKYSCDRCTFGEVLPLLGKGEQIAYVKWLQDHDDLVKFYSVLPSGRIDKAIANSLEVISTSLMERLRTILQPAKSARITV